MTLVARQGNNWLGDGKLPSSPCCLLGQHLRQGILFAARLRLRWWRINQQWQLEAARGGGKKQQSAICASHQNTKDRRGAGGVWHGVAHLWRVQEGGALDCGRGESTAAVEERGERQWRWTQGNGNNGQQKAMVTRGEDAGKTAVNDGCHRFSGGEATAAADKTRQCRQTRGRQHG